MYYLFNENYIIKMICCVKQKQIQKLCRYMVVSRVTFYLPLRSTDLERLGHPKLTREPLEVLG